MGLFDKKSKHRPESYEEQLRNFETRQKARQAIIRVNFCERARLLDNNGYFLDYDNKVRAVILKPETKSVYKENPNYEISFELYRAGGNRIWKDEFPAKAELLLVYNNSKGKVSEKTFSDCIVDSSDGSVFVEMDDWPANPSDWFCGAAVISALFEDGEQWKHAFPLEEKEFLKGQIKEHDVSRWVGYKSKK